MHHAATHVRPPPKCSNNRTANIFHFDNRRILISNVLCATCHSGHHILVSGGRDPTAPHLGNKGKLVDHRETILPQSPAGSKEPTSGVSLGKCPTKCPTPTNSPRIPPREAQSRSTTLVMPPCHNMNTTATNRQGTQ